ncbi:hypothetical protein RIF29_15020 [Crotalaria pallida]|uniref:OTU domain-containing protein n=1 Tax=Crotalaria pallida TaxID=3830 RepID=A0AAN9IC88_CROPI
MVYVNLDIDILFTLKVFALLKSYFYRLVTYGLAELQMEGDGNCQFQALADQLFRNPDHHKYVRKVTKQVVLSKKIQSKPILYAMLPIQTTRVTRFEILFVALNLKMTGSGSPTRSGEWGDHITLQAAADHVHVEYVCIRLYTLVTVALRAGSSHLAQVIQV